MNATRFFFQHAGYSYDPKTQTKIQGRWQCARSLADAEKHAQAMEWVAEWSFDEEEPWNGDSEVSEMLTCVLKNERGDVLAALCGIADPDYNYRRVIEAELASEAWGEIESSVIDSV